MHAGGMTEPGYCAIMVAMKKADLLDRLRGGITEEQWTALADGRLKISDFNRAVLLEMRNAHAKVYGEVDEARVSGLRASVRSRWVTIP